jgi:glutamate-1-semialdehyde 2,1-aminomutase
VRSRAALRIAAGRGAHVWDAGGHEYIDWTCGYGPVVLGHGHPGVAAAVFQQVLAGTLLPGRSDIEDALGERLLALFPAADSYLFVKTGSEAVSAAIRFARAHSGRRHVLRVGFHGWHDGLIDPKLGWHNWDNVRTPAPSPPGITPPGSLGIEIDHARSVDSVEARLRDRDQPPLAALVLDPIQLPDPNVDLPRVRQACDETTTLLVLDETKTAFRVVLGGVQELYGIHADLTVAGKALANGLPLSTVLGPADLVRARETRVKGTFSAERSALAAAHATLDVLEAEDVCTQLATIGADLIATLNDALSEQSLSRTVTAVPYRWNSMPHLHAATDDPHAQRIRSELIDAARRHGVLLLDGHNSFACAAHDTDDVRLTAEAVRNAASALKVVVPDA